jgi:fructose-1,6-bisphosphatase/inositol monophosphatase family enzyme
MTGQAGGFGRRQEEALIALVREAARTEIMPRFRRLSADEVRAKSRPDDLVTAADLASEAAITAGLRAIMPEARVIGEEAVAADAGLLAGIGDRLVAIVDPVDGTWNFANGLPLFGVIVAVAMEGRTLFGLLYDPVLDDWVLARRGGGAWFCRAGEAPVRLAASAAAEADAMAGFAAPFLFDPPQRRGVAEAMLRFRRASSLRCACHEYRLIAQGRAEFMVNAQVKPWDHAAGVLAVEEAGGWAGMLDGRPYDARVSDGRLLVAGSRASGAVLRETFGPALS